MSEASVSPKAPTLGSYFPPKPHTQLPSADHTRSAGVHLCGSKSYSRGLRHGFAPLMHQVDGDTIALGHTRKDVARFNKGLQYLRLDLG